MAAEWQHGSCVTRLTVGLRALGVSFDHYISPHIGRSSRYTTLNTSQVGGNLNVWGEWLHAHGLAYFSSDLGLQISA